MATINIKAIRQMLEQPLAVIDTDETTGEKLEQKHISRRAYLAQYEIEHLLTYIKEYTK